MVANPSHFDWMRNADIIRDIVYTYRDYGLFKWKCCPEGFELAKAEFTVVKPLGKWEQDCLHRKLVRGEEGYEDQAYDNEFEVISGLKLDVKSVTAQLDKIAAQLELAGKQDLAYALDEVSDMLEGRGKGRERKKALAYALEMFEGRVKIDVPSTPVPESPQTAENVPRRRVLW